MLGDNIKKLREALGFTQQKFAERIGIKQATLSMAESGKSNISRQALLSISREFGVRLEWLETGEGEMYSERNMSIIEQLSEEFQLDDKSREFLENFLRLTPENRRLVVSGLEQAAKLYPRNKPEERRIKPDSELTTEEAMEKVRYEWEAKMDAEKRGILTSSASTGLNGASKKFSTKA